MSHAGFLPTLLFALCVPHVVLGDPPRELPPSGSVPPELFATGFGLAGGLAFDNSGNFYAANYRTKGTIGRITPGGQAAIWCDVAKLAPVAGREPQANGLKVSNEGSVIAADSGAGRLLRISPDGKQIEVLAERVDGTRFMAIHDVALLGNAIFFTDPGNSSEQKPTGSVYRFDVKSRVVTRLATGLAFPAGLAASPDKSHLCVAEGRRFRVLLFDLATDGMVSNQRVLIDFPEKDAAGIRGGAYDPSGMIFDENGLLYVAMGSGGFVNVVEVPSGKLVRQFDAGGANVTNCHFFGQSLFVSVAANEAIYRLNLGVRGFDYRPQ